MKKPNKYQSGGLPTLEDLLGNSPLNFQDFNLGESFSQPNIDAIESREFDRTDYIPKGLNKLNPFAWPKAIINAKKDEDVFNKQKEEDLAKAKEKGDAMNTLTNTLGVLMQGQQGAAAYNSIGPDQLSPVKGSFGFQQGGVAGINNQTSYPQFGGTGYIDSIMNKTRSDLQDPVTTKKGLKDKVNRAESLMEAEKLSIFRPAMKSGMINKTGYTPGTASFNNPMNIIPGGEITMENTPFDVQGIPINEYGEPVGEAITMKPGGFYKFPNAFGVLEIPKMQYEGKIKKYQMGGTIEEQQLSPIQTEKGEYVTLPDMTTTKTLANKRHSQYEDDEITDVLPVGSMIWSNDPQLKMSQNDYIAGMKLKDMPIGKTPMLYSETEQQKPQEDVLLFDGFTKNKFTPADFAKSVKRRMPITDRENDAFAELAKNENRIQRAEHLIPFAELATYKKDMVEFTEGLDRQEPKSKFQMGGTIGGGPGISKYMKRMMGDDVRDNAAQGYDPASYAKGVLSNMATKSGLGTISPIASFNFGSINNVPKAQAGAIAGAIGSLFNLGIGIGDRITQGRRYRETISDIEQAEADNVTNINNAANINYGMTLSNLGLQDTGYTNLNLDDVISSNETAYSDALQRQASERNAAMAMNEARANTAALNPNLTYNELMAMQANAGQMNNQTALQYSNMGTQTMLQGNQMRNRYLETLARDRQIGSNTRRQNQNILLGNTTSNFAKTGASQQQAIMDNRNMGLAARMGARGQQANFLVNSGTNLANAASDMAYYASQMDFNFGNNNPPSLASQLGPIQPSSTQGLPVPQYPTYGPQINPIGNVWGPASNVANDVNPDRWN